MFSVNWVFDELFVREDLYEAVFKRIGIAGEKVLLYKKETQIEETIQLVIPDTDTSLCLDGYSFEICNECGRKRYDLIREGLFPAFRSEPKEKNIFKSKEWFGTGASARKYIFISQEIRELLTKSKGDINYLPCSKLSPVKNDSVLPCVFKKHVNTIQQMQ
jgi:hypothetical protein